MKFARQHMLVIHVEDLIDFGIILEMGWTYSVGSTYRLHRLWYHTWNWSNL